MSDDFELVPDVISVPKNAPLEKDVEARFAKRIKSAGGHSWKFVSVNNRGVSDRIVIIHGRVIFVELKRDGGKMTPLQKIFMQKVIDNGGEFAEVEGMEGVNRFMHKLKVDQSMWKTFFRAIWSMVNKFKGKV